MKKKINFDSLLKEQRDRIKLLESYDFYTGKQEEPEHKELILGNNGLDEEEDLENAPEDIANELGVEPPKDNGGDVSPPENNPVPQPEPTQTTVPQPEPTPEPSNDDVEVDVTELVKGSEEATHSANMANKNSELLLKKIEDLEAMLNRMGDISNKIEEIEKEVIKRNPTPLEKMDLISLSSYPYTQKLTDFWKEKGELYDADENKPEEYILTKDDVDNSYIESNIKKSFDADFDEEDVY